MALTACTTDPLFLLIFLSTLSFGASGRIRTYVEFPDWVATSPVRPLRLHLLLFGGSLGTRTPIRSFGGSYSTIELTILCLVIQKDVL